MTRPPERGRFCGRLDLARPRCRCPLPPGDPARPLITDRDCPEHGPALRRLREAHRR